MKIYPIGYNSPHGGNVETIMADNPDVYLCDIRLVPQSQWRPEWRRASLVKQYGDERYHHIPLLGNVNYKNGGPIEIASPEHGIDTLCQYLKEGHDLILLCQCNHYEKCHRQVIVDLLLAAMPDVEVVFPEPVKTVQAIQQALL